MKFIAIPLLLLSVSLFAQTKMPKGYNNELAAANKRVGAITNRNCWGFTVEGFFLIADFYDAGKAKMDVRNLDRVVYDSLGGVTISCKGGKKCIDFGGGKLESSVKIAQVLKAGENPDRNSYRSVSVAINFLAEAIRYTNYTDAEWADYIKKTQPQNEGVWKAALNDFNEYLMFVNDGQPDRIEVQGGYLFYIDKDNRPMIKAHIDDVVGCFILKENMSYGEAVVIGRVNYDGPNDEIGYSYLWEVTTGKMFLASQKTAGDKKRQLINKANMFLYALKGKPVPPELAIKEDVKTDAEVLLANAKTPFEKALVELQVFLKNKAYGNTYFNKVEYAGNTLTFNMLKSDEQVLLDRVGLMYMINVDVEKPRIEIISAPKNGYAFNRGGNYYESTGFGDFDREDAFTFFQYFGNVLDTYQEEILKVKPPVTYAEKLKKITAPAYLEKIEDGSVVKIVGAKSTDKNAKKINKLIGEEVTINGALNINADMESYNGKFTNSKGTALAASEVLVTYVKGKNGEDAIAQRTAQAVAKQAAALKMAIHDKNLLDGLKFVHQFLTASQQGNLSSYTKYQSDKTVSPSGKANRYGLKIPGMPAFVDWVDLFIITDLTDKTLYNQVEISFPDQYLALFTEIMEYKEAGYRLEEAHTEKNMVNGEEEKVLFVNGSSIILLHRGENKKYSMTIYEHKGLAKKG